LSAFPGPVKVDSKPPSAIFASSILVEPLTDRELEVLGLMAAGFSNKEIAEKLVVSIGTVKAHTHSIYGKLDVQGRTKAVARA